MRKVIFRLILLISASLTYFCANLSAHGYPPSFFIRYNIEDGLASSTVFASRQDHKGYIWFGTDAGLCRFNGYSFQQFNIKDNLPNNDVYDLYEDSEKRLWLLSLGYLSYQKDGKFIVPDFVKKYNLKAVRSVFEDSDKNLWVTLNSVVYKFNPKGEKLLKTKKMTNPEIIDPRITSQTKEKVWVFNGYPNFSSISKKDVKDIRNYSIPNEERTIFPFINFVINNHVYFIGKKAFYRFHRNEPERITNLKDKAGLGKLINGHASKMIKAKDGTFWVSSYQDGVFHINISNDTVNLIAHYLKGEPITDLIQDREGNFWITSNQNGIFLLPSEAYKSTEIIQGIGRIGIISLMKQGDKVWIGTRRNEIYSLENRTLKKYKIEYSNRVRIKSIAKFSDGRAVFGTDIGLYSIFNKLEKHQPNMIAVKDLHIDSKDDLYVAMHSGAIKIDKLNFEKTIGRESRGWDTIYEGRTSSIFYDEKRQMTWIGTPSGLISSKGGKIYHYDSLSPIFTMSISDVKVDESSDNLVWLATNGGGVAIFNPETGSLLNLTTDENLISNICNDIYFSKYSAIISTNQGISIISLKDARQSYKIASFDKINGLPSNEIYTVTQSGKNTLIIGTNEGVIFLDESKLNQYSVPPLLDIYNVKIEEADSIARRSYNLSYHQNDLKIEFNGLSFKSIKRISYKYRLLPNREWVSTRSNFARFNTLKPGNYTFEVFATNKEGINSEVSRIDFTIRQPWWQAAWFICLCAFLFALLVIGIMRYIRQSNRNKELAYLIEIKNSELNEKLRELERSNDELSQFAHVVSHDLKEPLRTIASFLQLLEMRNRKVLDKDSFEYIDFAVGGVKRLESIINDLLIFSRIDRSEYDVREWVRTEDILEVVIHGLNQKIEEQRGKIVYSKNLPDIHCSEFQVTQLFQNLIDNGLKYQAEHNQPVIEILFSETPDFWQFGIKDNGIGIDEEYQEKVFKMFQRLHNRDEYSGTGIGLAICKKIVLNHHGEIWFESNHSGTTFFFTLKKPNG